MKKHAYLILAHKNMEQLSSLVSLLDDDRNDIYVHIDAKCAERNKARDFACGHSSIYIYNDIDVRWGDYSIVEAEMLLLKEAVKKDYSYYHLISGEDLPIKTKEYIYNFFEKTKKEFVLFTDSSIRKKDLDRVQYRHFFTKKLRRNGFTVLNKVYERLDAFLVRIEKILHIKKKTPYKNYQKGSQWFSITGDFAKYVVSNEDSIKKTFKNTLFPDEMFIQTILINSPFIYRLYEKEKYNDCIQNSRYIDWDRGKPYSFREDDFNDIIESSCCFARKFSWDKGSKKIFSKICDYIGEKKNEKTK